MVCPKCNIKTKLTRHGCYIRRSDKKKHQRYSCAKCNYRFSSHCHSLSYRLQKRSINQIIFRSLCSGVSQRRCAKNVGVCPQTIARRVQKFGEIAEKNLNYYRKTS